MPTSVCELKKNDYSMLASDHFSTTSMVRAVYLANRVNWY